MERLNENELEKVAGGLQETYVQHYDRDLDVVIVDKVLTPEPFEKVTEDQLKQLQQVKEPDPQQVFIDYREKKVEEMNNDPDLEKALLELMNL